MNRGHLSCLLDAAVAAGADRPAVEDDRGRAWTYAELDRIVDRVHTRLARWGVGRGDRVGLFLPKSLEAVATIHGVLRAGAAYVPVDPFAPAARGASILADAGVKVAIVDAALVGALRSHWPQRGPSPRLVAVGDAVDAADRLDSWDELAADDAPSPLRPRTSRDDLAYILYTSGSTGVPKGVMLTHANALCFLDWCRATFKIGPDDRFASHAPFHFDLSVFDLYASCGAGGTLVLAGESLGKDPARLGAFVSERSIDVWYSAPSILAMLVERGGIDRPDRRAPRVVLFAGEVFPIAPLRKLRGIWPHAELWNLYGPTETNVCTAQPIPSRIPDDRDQPYPIGAVCPPLRARVVDEHGSDVAAGALGELVIAGQGVMRGYFGRPDLTNAAFFHDDRAQWYRTGDLVRDDGTGCYHFHGRRDRMVKKRGYRVELGEIEAALYRNDDVERAAVVARDGAEGVVVRAFVKIKPDRKASIIAVKRHCGQLLPNYMIPDVITFLDQLPTTSTDKVDYQGLTQWAASHV